MPRDTAPHNVFFIRHGQTEWNAEGKKQGGGGDSPLTQKGREQVENNAQVLKEYLKDSPYPPVIISSPLGRTVETSRILCENLGIDPEKIIYDDRLIETGFGKFEGKSSEECKTLWPEDYKKFKENPCAVETCEPLWRIHKRVSGFIEEYNLKNESRDRNIIIVAHSGISRYMRGILMELPISELQDIRSKVPTQGNDEVYKLTGAKAEILKQKTADMKVPLQAKVKSKIVKTLAKERG